MKKNLIFSIAVLIVSFTSSEKKIYKKGINFFKGTYTEALAKAKEENKPVFLDVYAGWCGPCKKLKKTTFKDETVGEYFNKNFICIFNFTSRIFLNICSKVISSSYIKV